ncbi:hypothetical protein Tco_0134109 [Tanacetum coccineum]
MVEGATKDGEIIHKYIHAVLNKLMEYGYHTTLKGDRPFMVPKNLEEPDFFDALAVARKGRHKMIGTSSSSSISKTTKSTGKMNLLIFTNRFSQIPMGKDGLDDLEVRLSDVGHGEAGKGGSWVLTPDLVVTAKVVGYRHSDKTLKGKDHHRCLPQTSIPTRLGWFACIHQPHGILRSSRRLVGGILSSHSAAFPLREKWKKSSLDVSLVAPSACMGLGDVGGLAPVLLEEDASASKWFLSAIARDSFCCRH